MDNLVSIVKIVVSLGFLSFLQLCSLIPGIKSRRQESDAQADSELGNGI